MMNIINEIIKKITNDNNLYHIIDNGNINFQFYKMDTNIEHHTENLYNHQEIILTKTLTNNNLNHVDLVYSFEGHTTDDIINHISYKLLSDFFNKIDIETDFVTNRNTEDDLNIIIDNHHGFKWYTTKMLMFELLGDNKNFGYEYKYSNTYDIKGVPFYTTKPIFFGLSEKIFINKREIRIDKYNDNIRIKMKLYYEDIKVVGYIKQDIDRRQYLRSKKITKLKKIISSR